MLRKKYRNDGSREMPHWLRRVLVALSDDHDWVCRAQMTAHNHPEL